MRQLSYILALLFISSCIDNTGSSIDDRIPKESYLTTAFLKDSLGTVSYYLPVRYDTSFVWTNHSDCGKPCDHEQYRFQSKKQPISKESGFYYEILEAPTDCFTVIHSSYFPFHNGDTARSAGSHELFKSRLSSDPKNGTILFDTLERIHDRYFSIVYLQSFDKSKKMYFARVASMTTIKGNEIEFQYDLRTMDTLLLKDFYRVSINYLRTIRISNGI